ncbi:ATP-binding protein [Streptomyces chartreusis]
MYLPSSRTSENRDLSAGPALLDSVKWVAAALPDRVGGLRRQASAVFDAWMPDPDERGSAVLIVSELLTNAAVHGRSIMELTLGLRHRDLEITVSDRGRPTNTISPMGSRPDEGGRGLDIVAALAAHVRTEQRHDGRRVRVRMELSRPPRSGGTGHPVQHSSRVPAHAR